MPRILNITVEVEDSEFQNFLARLGNHGTVNTGAAIDDDDEAPAAPVNPGELDTNGVPWMESVHAGSKGKTQDGSWRGKKGVSAEDRKKVEDAWKASNSGGTFPVPESISGVPGGINLPLGNVPSTATGLPGFPSPTAIPTPPAPVTFDELVGKYQKLADAGKIDPNAMQALYNKHGIANPATLQTDESLRRKMMDDLNALG